MDKYTFEVWVGGRWVGYVFALNACNAAADAKRKYGSTATVSWYVG